MLATSSRTVRVERVMGTVVSLDARGGPTASVPDALRRLHDVDRRFSTYRPGSEICRLERGELLVADASEDVRWVLERCQALRRETGGVFDIRATRRPHPSAPLEGRGAPPAPPRLP